MHLILTHEQADFDAIASLFGAYLLADEARPVLPRRINRNARAFVTLYGMDFPFIDPRDQPQGAIESITLVDTQSLITLKGMSERTIIHIFDHHQRRGHQKTSGEKGAIELREVTSIETGAATTYFVELIQERGELLSIIQATLLLLGIYEDTGSLTYASTTPRDVRAAAWLLEQGASLRIAVEFLNPPLSAGQRDTYDRLVASAETIDQNGHRVVLVCGEVADLNEEISTLAHKLRELFDTDALFVLVQTLEGVRLVARSTTDDIDVAAITSHFGGGGHDRAAAALIREKIGKADGQAPKPHDSATLLQRTRASLLALLPRHIRASVTVAQIMSKRPRVLAPDISAQDAAKLMQRYGYEGFPVVGDGKVIGLLTRRAVDRAVSHRLNLPASSLMDAGEVVVHPEDSLQHLQVCMSESGWGQIPVVDADGKIVGIVTRTDLLKSISRRLPHAARQPSLAHKLDNFLLPEHLAIIKGVADEAATLHMPVYIVGGFVRDLLLNRPSLDFDIVVEGDAILLARALVEKHGGHITTHTRFGTAKWFIEKSNVAQPLFIDLISSRQEFYEHPSALPTVEHGSIKLDLHRRDFTINTLALRLDGRHFGELHDYFSGLSDLEHRYVRVLHSLSFVDDPTRMVRAVRYEQRYGFDIEHRTLQLIEEARPLIARLTGERIRHELDLIFDEPLAANMLDRLGELGLLSSISDVLPWNFSLRQQIDTALGQPIPDEWGLKSPAAGIPLNRALGYTLWLIKLPPAQIETIHARLRFPLALYKTLLAASNLLIDLPGLLEGKASLYVERLEDVPVLAVYASYLATGENALAEYAQKWRHIHSRTNGDTLLAMGLKPGPNFQNILRVLRSAWVDGQVTNADEESALLNKLISSENA
jgi:tRNA nucleotidyltransferase (CCA-adding enzyme)